MTTACLFRCRIDRLISQIDETLNRQMNKILHHPRLQALEASWLGLAMLTRQAGIGSNVKICVLNVSWAQLAIDMACASDFDQSQLFQFIYNREFGMPGGEPFGLLIGDYMLAYGIKDGHDVVSTLAAVSMTAAAAFCPFLTGAAPQILDLDDFSALSRLPDLSRIIQDTARRRWENLRRNEESRFLGLVAPRILMRMPYEANTRKRNDYFSFREIIDDKGTNLVWGNAAYAFAMVIIRNFIETGWFADIRGVSQDGKDGGFLSSHELPPYDTHHESAGLSAQPPVEVRLTNLQEQQFTDLGIIPVTTTYMSAAIVFNANQSMHMSAHYLNENARENARLAAMLQYVLCASRFAHYLKVIMRDQIGRVRKPESIQENLQSWLSAYTLGNDDADLSLQRRYPLRSANVAVREAAGHPGEFICMVHLQPHFQLDDVSVSFQLIADINTASGTTKTSAQKMTT